jgi:glycosyltransferase involved in cell wall biosynthesis
MKLFFFITKSEAGGAQTHVAQLTRFFVSRGDDVVVMSTPGGWLEGETTKLGGRFVANASLGNTPNPFRLWKASRRFRQAVNASNPDIVACHSTMAGLLGRLTIRNRIPTVFTAHGWGFQPGAPLLRRFILPLLERLAGRFSRRIICVSQHDLKLARANRIAPREKLVQIYNGIEASRSLDSAPFGRSARDDTSENTDTKSVQIYFVGRLAPPKNPFLLVEAFARLARELQDKTRVVIIGEGPDRKRLEEQIRERTLQDHIELVGALPREAVLARLRDEADLFVLLSHWEGFPYSILEAMAAGVPVIASDVGGIREAVTPEVGILVPDHDSDRLTYALARMIEDPELRQAMGTRAQERAHTLFSVSRMCEETFRVYNRLV